MMKLVFLLVVSLGVFALAVLWWSLKEPSRQHRRTTGRVRRRQHRAMGQRVREKMEQEPPEKQ